MTWRTMRLVAGCPVGIGPHLLPLPARIARIAAQMSSVRIAQGLARERRAGAVLPDLRSEGGKAGLDPFGGSAS